MRKKELPYKKELHEEVAEVIKESPSVADYIKAMPLIEAIRELITDRRQWVEYALDNEISSERYRQGIIHALSIPEREWTKEKILTMLKQALGEYHEF